MIDYVIGLSVLPPHVLDTQVKDGQSRQLIPTCYELDLGAEEANR